MAICPKSSNDSRTYAPTRNNDACPISRFCETGRVSQKHNQCHFGCPVIVMRNEIQDGKKAR
jgi:hypothetical protein